jgi:hypothetical protein
LRIIFNLKGKKTKAGLILKIDLISLHIGPWQPLTKMNDLFFMFVIADKIKALLSTYEFIVVFFVVLKISMI